MLPKPICIKGDFAQVNIKVVSSVDLKFEFVDHTTGDPIVVEAVYVTFFDLDHGKGHTENFVVKGYSQVCVCTCLCTCVSRCLNTCLHTCPYTSLCTCQCTCLCRCLHRFQCTYLRTGFCTHLHTFYTHAYAHVDTHVHAYVYIRGHTVPHDG